jgi:hypothetical protein
MKSNQQDTRQRGLDRAMGRSHEQPKQSDRGVTARELLSRMGLWGVFVLAAVTLGSIGAAFLFAGCGSNDTSTQVAQQQTSAIDVSGASVMPASAPPASSSNESDRYVTSADSLPPEVAVTVSESTVVPGGVIEITAESSPDAVEVTLSDGIGKQQPLAYDDAGKVWRGFYRVPLRTSSERLGLSVVAKNGAHRWHRVWTFLTIDREEPCSPDSSMTK